MIINITLVNHFPRRRLVTLKVTSSRFRREVVWPKNSRAHDPMRPKSSLNRNSLSIIQPKDSTWKYQKTRGLKSSKSIGIVWGNRVKLLLIIVTEMIISSALIWTPAITQLSKCQTTQHTIRTSMESKSLWRRNFKSRIILGIVRAL